LYSKKMPRGVFPNPIERGRRISEALKGRKHSEETKKKMSISRMGSVPWNKGLKGFGSGEKNGMWKGDQVGYFGLHYRIIVKFGKHPSYCELCGARGKKNGRMWSIHWANKSGEYKYERSDWFPLCVPCHRAYDDSIAKMWITRKKLMQYPSPQ
jgi:hypothetical protein